MVRTAILVGNPVSWEPNPELSVDVTRVTRTLNHYAYILDHLGEDSFTSEVITNRARDTAREDIPRAVNKHANELEALKDTERSAACLLLYYFGHADIRGEKLRLVFGRGEYQVDDDNRPRLLELREVLGWVINRPVIKNLVLILDCCFAGAAKYSLTWNSNLRYALLASSSSAAYSRIRGESGKRPAFGAFSSAVFNSFQSERAIRRPELVVTPRSLHEAASDQLETFNVDQTPVYKSDKMDTFALRTLEGEPKFASEVDLSQPIRSVYRKLWYILEELVIEDWDIDSLYDRIKKNPPSQFTVRVETDSQNKRVAYVVRKSTFSEYFHLLRRLGLVRSDNGKLTLTENGKTATANKGVGFNKLLVEQIDKDLTRHNAPLKDLSRLLLERTRQLLVSAADDLYFDAAQSLGLRMPLGDFRILIDLASRAGYFVGTGKRTYHPNIHLEVDLGTT